MEELLEEKKFEMRAYDKAEPGSALLSGPFGRNGT